MLLYKTALELCCADAKFDESFLGEAIKGFESIAKSIIPRPQWQSRLGNCFPKVYREIARGMIMCHSRGNCPQARDSRGRVYI